MAIDFDKIREKVAQLSGQGKKSSMWRPEPGNEYEVRFLPWPDGNNGQPFRERSFYYNIGNGRAILAPSQFGKKDPVQELINKLRSDGRPEAMELAKQYYPKRRYYAPIIVRGKEDEGVKLWSFGKQICESLLNYMLGDFGDITDPKEGRDVKVVCKQQPGKQFADTTVAPRIPQTPLGPAAKMKEWLKGVPDLDEIYQQTPAEEIEKRLNEHLNGDSGDGLDSKDNGGRRNASSDVSSEEHSSIDDVFAKLGEVVEG